MPTTITAISADLTGKDRTTTPIAWPTDPGPYDREVIELRPPIPPIAHTGKPGSSALRRAVACALALSLMLVASAHGAARKPPKPTCSASGGRTLSRSHQIRVFARKGLFYSCWLASRRRTTLGRVGEEVPNMGAVLSTHVRIDGEYVAFSVQESGDPGYNLSQIISVNARTGRAARRIEPLETENFDSFVEDVGVAADDAIVYVQRDGAPCPGAHTTGELGPDSGVIAVEPGAKRHTLDCEIPGEPEGSISRLVVKGQTATWTHSGVPRSATLR
jgi:hypothetical protein